MTQDALLEREAKDPSTLPERLTALSKYPRLAPLVAQNPNTPEDVLLKLAAKYPQEFIENPVSVLLLLERPGLVEQLPNNTILGIVRLPALPVEWLQIIASYPNEAAQTALAQHPNTPTQVLQLLARSKFSQTQKAVAQREDASPALLQLCAEGRFIRVLEAIAIHPAAPAALLSSMLEYSEVSIRSRAAKHPSCPPEKLAQLRRAGASEWLETLHAGDPTMTPDELAAMSRRGFFSKSLAARHPNTTLATQRSLIKDESPEVRGYLASSPSLPEELLEALSLDATPHVRSEVAKNPRTPSRILTAFPVAHESDAVKQALAENHALPSEIFHALVASPPKPSQPFLQALNKNPRVPAELLARFAFASSKTLRAVAATHPSTAPPLKDLFCRAGAADFLQHRPEAQQDLTEEERTALIGGGYFGRWLALQNPSTPSEHLARLAWYTHGEAFEQRLLQDPKYKQEPLFAMVAAHPNTNHETLSYLWEQHHGQPGVPRALALQRSTPPKILSDLIQQQGHLWGAELVQHPCITPEQKTRLALLPKQTKAIRALLIQQPDAEVALLIAACSADDYELRRLAIAQPKTPKSFLALLWQAGASEDLFWFQAPKAELSLEELLGILSFPQLGGYLREVIARYPSCPQTLLDILADPTQALPHAAGWQSPTKPNAEYLQRAPLRLTHALACHPNLSPALSHALGAIKDVTIEDALCLHQRRDPITRAAPFLGGTVELTLPKLAEYFEEGPICRVYCRVGQQVKLEEVLFDVETDCMPVDIPSPCDGIVAGIFVAKGETIPVGRRMALLYRTIPAQRFAIEEPPATGLPLELQARQNLVEAWYREKTGDHLPAPFFIPVSSLHTPRYSAISVHSAFLAPNTRRLLWTDGREVIEGGGAFARLLQREGLIQNPRALSAQQVARLWVALEQPASGEVLSTITKARLGLHPPMLVREDQGNRWVFWTKSSSRLRCWCLWLEGSAMRHREIVVDPPKAPEEQ